MANKRKVILIGWDSADWRIISPLVDAGAMPALAGVIERGVMGNIASIDPVLSPLIWTSIATGKYPHKHGVLGFVEPDPLGSGIRITGSASRTSKAIWNILSEAGLDTHMVGWYASHPAEPIRGICASDRFPLVTSAGPANWPLPAGAISPSECSAELAGLRVHPHEIVGGQILPFIPMAASLDQREPEVARRMNLLAATLAQAASVQAAATWIIENRSWDFFGVYFQALDELGHHFMPFRPPRLPGVEEKDVEIYGQVMDVAYRFHDMMLARLLALAGPDVTVVLVSDHGFKSDEHRPGVVANDPQTMAEWHRPFGVLAMAGPGIVRDERIYGSSVLDVTPTILHLFDLPAGQDMDGKILLSAFENQESLQRIPTWESSGKEAGAGDFDAQSHEDEEAVYQQLMELGYMDVRDADTEERLRWAEKEQCYNRITSLMSAGRSDQAEKPARELIGMDPRERRYRIKLVQILLLLNKVSEAEADLSQLEEELGPCLTSRCIRANILILQSKVDEALAELREVVAAHPRDPRAHEQLGRALLRQRRWKEAETHFRQTVSLEPDSPYACVGLARSLVRQDKDAEALEWALAGVGLQYFLPLGHFQMGAILSKMNLPTRAIQAFETGLNMQPGNLLAHRYLCFLYLRGGRAEQAASHRRHVEQLLTGRCQSAS